MEGLTIMSCQGAMKEGIFFSMMETGKCSCAQTYLILLGRAMARSDLYGRQPYCQGYEGTDQERPTGREKSEEA
jgi:hypothetical protein